MRRLLMLALALMVAMPILMLPNCSDPLESITDPELDPPGPITIIDTVYITRQRHSTLGRVTPHHPRRQPPGPKSPTEGDRKARNCVVALARLTS